MWNKNYSECVVCKGTKIKYHAKGKCRTCYSRTQMKEIRENDPERMKKIYQRKHYLDRDNKIIRAKKWIKNNPEKFKQIRIKYRESHRERFNWMERVRRSTKEINYRDKKSALNILNDIRRAIQETR